MRKRSDIVLRLLAGSQKYFVHAMPPRRQIAAKPDRKQDLKSWLKREYKDPVKYQANVVRIAQTGVVCCCDVCTALTPVTLNAATFEGSRTIRGVHCGHAKLWRRFCHLNAPKAAHHYEHMQIPGDSYRLPTILRSRTLNGLQYAQQFVYQGACAQFTLAE